jgi:hypothetical protein
LCSFTTGTGQTLPGEPAAKLLLDRFGSFTAAGAATSPKPELIASFGNDIEANQTAARYYKSKDGQRFLVTIIKTRSDSVAYALLTEARNGLETTQGLQSVKKAEVGAESFLFSDRLIAVKGPVLIAVNGDGPGSRESQSLVQIGKAVADTLDKGEGDIPVLVKHLPDWQMAERRILYVVNQNTLKKVISNQPIIETVSFEGGVEAAIANYDNQRLVVIEFNTPQLATENNDRITARVQELRNQGQPVPTAYRRVGNYSVFVFDAPSELAANQLIDQVKYQQVVQWLGKNPYAYGDAVREFTQTTLGVLVSVVKASGLVLLGSIAVGGFLGAVLFTRRRSQQQVRDAYSDAGGMLRLNLDEMDPNTDPARLLGPRN